jgi:hypothetical protein
MSRLTNTEIIWTTGNDEEIDVRQMSTFHIKRTLEYLHRRKNIIEILDSENYNFEGDELIGDYTADEWITIFKNELVLRKNEKLF